MKLRMGNRITKRHVYYGNYKMKVCYAAQLFSNSVATALDVARSDKYEKLINSDTTAYLCRIINELFDFCNSRSQKTFGTKEALTNENYMSKKKRLFEILEILKNITYYNVPKRKKGFIGPLQASLDLVRDSRRKTFILGFAVTLHTIFDLGKELIDTEDEPVTHFYTYLLQQDFIESFFSLIRLHGGWDNNPAPHQIKYIMRKLIVMQCGGVTASLNTNCIAPPTFVEYEVDIEEDENSAACLQIAIDAAEILENNHYLEASGQSCEDRLGNLKNGTIAYMAGHL
jgi:hypothetical protein